MKNLFVALALLTVSLGFAQDPFPYRVQLDAVSVPNLPGLHSYAIAQDAGKWLIIGGRKDGMHARQPFSSFPEAYNNTDIYVVDIQSGQFWSSSVNSLAVGLKEQLQSTNMNFYQDGNVLYIIGGYGYSTTAVDHITFDGLISIDVPQLINAVVNGTTIAPYFKSVTDSVFAITGGQLGKIGNTFYMVGGQRFDGRYNPMGHNTYVQKYTNQIRMFTIDNSGSQLSFSNYQVLTDAIHLHRRDYNLLPQIFPDGSSGYTISSGVFQPTQDLPFLYPVDIKPTGHSAVTSFNQYLSNYHSATAALFDSVNNAMHSLFFGGMSEYYYQNGSLVQDITVPFVKTISRVSRASDGSLNEYQLAAEMPGLKGASAEFIPNHGLAHYDNEILKIHKFQGDTILIGHIFGGIQSPIINPFTSNQTANTSADPTIYAVKLVYDIKADAQEIDGQNPYSLFVSPNPASDQINVRFSLKQQTDVHYILSDVTGRILQKQIVSGLHRGENELNLDLSSYSNGQNLLLTLVFEGRYFVTERILIE